ncbi:MAG: GNAT family N-acetyltransferase [Candidatus Latescibacterota bacterium]
MDGGAHLYRLRQATPADLPGLADIRPPAALHRDRLRDADGQGLLYLVVEEGARLIGFGLLVFEWPTAWPAVSGPVHVPLMVDVQVRPASQGQGAGTFLIRQMEDIARGRGAAALYLQVDPVDNARARRLYLRLGYSQLPDEPHKSHWRFTDSDGAVHEGDGWQVDMRKILAVQGRGEGAPDR